MQRREFPIVVRKNGDQFIPFFPVELEEGDQFLIAREMVGSEVPKGKNWTLKGYSNSGPIISQR